MELRPLCFASAWFFFAPALLKVGRSVSTSSENLQMTSQSSGFGGLFCLSFAFHRLILNNDADSSEEEIFMIFCGSKCYHCQLCLVDDILLNRNKKSGWWIWLCDLSPTSPRVSHPLLLFTHTWTHLFTRFYTTHTCLHTPSYTLAHFHTLSSRLAQIRPFCRCCWSSSHQLLFQHFKKQKERNLGSTCKGSVGNENSP